MSQGVGLNVDLLTQSLNYHGSELTRLISGSAVFEELDPKKLNYQIYTKRSKDLTDGRTQRTALHQFIENKLEALFARRLDPVGDEDPVFKQPLPLLDMWMGERTTTHRNEEFYKKLQTGDVLLCIPSNQVPGGMGLDVLAHMSVRGKMNYTGDLKLKAVLPNTEVYGDHKPQFGSIYKLCVMNGEDCIRPLVTLKWSSVPRQARFLEQKTELGVVRKKELPTGLADFLTGHSSMSFKSVIEEIESFRSPTGIQEMAADLGIPLQTGTWSLYNGLSPGRYPPEVTADGIERAQMSLMAKQCHSEGIEFYEKKDTFRAHNCFNRALSFDPNHVESLFARGSLYANDMKYSNALEDLKGALRLDPMHQSCIDYTTKVLKILAASLLKSEKLDEAVRLCDSVLEIIPENQKVIAMKKEILSYKDSSSDSQGSEDELRQTENRHIRSKDQAQDRVSPDSSQTTANGAHTLETEKVTQTGPSSSTSAALHSTSSHPAISSSQRSYGLNEKPPSSMPDVPMKVESEHERACREFLEKNNSKRKDSSRYSRDYGSSSPEKPFHGKSKYRKSPDSFKDYSREKRSPNERNKRHDNSVRNEDHFSNRESKFGSHEKPKWESKSHYTQDHEDRRATKYEKPSGRYDYKDETIHKRDQRSKSYETKKSKRNTSKGERNDRESDENSKRESVTKKDRRSKSRSSKSTSVERKPSKSSKIDPPDYVWVEKDGSKKSKKKKSKKKSSRHDESSDDYSKSSHKKRHRHSSEGSNQYSPKKRHTSESPDFERHHRKRKKYSFERESSEDSTKKSTPKKLKQWEKRTRDMDWMTKSYNDKDRDSRISSENKKPQEFSRSFSPNALKAFQVSDDEEDEESTNDKNRVSKRY